MATKPIDKHVFELEEMVGDIPRLINLRFSHTRAQLDALDARLGTVEIKIDGLRTEMQAQRSEMQAQRNEMQAQRNELQALRKDLPDVIANAVGDALRKK
jgi:chromosome segregation ATPase